MNLGACGGGGGSAPPANQSVGGIWTSQYSVTSGANTGGAISAEGIVSETDGSNSGSGTFTGTVSQRASLSLSETDTMAMGSVLAPSTTAWTFSNLYLSPSSLSTIAGNYDDGGQTLSITSDGVIFEQNPNGCITNGQVSIINASYNAYAVQITWSSCVGTSANRDGVTVSRLATLDTSTSPPTLFGGLDGNANGLLYVFEFQLSQT